MKKIWHNYNWDRVSESFEAVSQRFPLSLGALVGIATLVVMLIADLDIDQDLATRSIMTLILVVWLSLAARLMGESYKISVGKHIYLYVGVAMLALGYYAVLPSDMDSVYGEFYITHIGIHLAMIVSVVFALGMGPWWRGQYQDSLFYNLVVTVGMFLFQSVVISLVTFVAGASVIGSVDLLFDPSWINQDPYLYWLVFAGILVGPVFFLCRFPQEMPHALEVGERFLHVLVRYIALPFICIYFVILYAYTIKVLVNFGDWPEGVVTWLVIWFSVFGYITYILSYHMREEWWVESIRRWTPILLLPQLGMLFYAIGLRINQHDWTINRYLVVAFGVWLVVLSLYFILKKNAAHLITIPASLFVAIVLVLFGPWNMFSVSERSQQSRLELLMNQTSLTNVDESSAVSIIQYLCEYHGCDSVYEVASVANKLSKRYDHYWDIITELGLEYWQGPETSPYRYYHYSGLESYSVGGFKTLERIGSYEWDQGNVYYDVSSQRLFVNGDSIDINQDLFALTVSAQKEGGLVENIVEFSHLGETYRLFIGNMSISSGTGTETVDSITGMIAY